MRYFCSIHINIFYKNIIQLNKQFNCSLNNYLFFYYINVERPQVLLQIRKMSQKSM